MSRSEASAITRTKRHLRDDDEGITAQQDQGILRKQKRFKLDNLLKNLSLEDSQNEEISSHESLESASDEEDISAETQYLVHPSFKFRPLGMSDKSDAQEGDSTNINNFVAEKLLQQHINTLHSSNGKLILWYLPSYVISYHFQRWAVRLFNRFTSKYETQKNRKKFTFFYKIMDLVKLTEVNLLYEDVLRILSYESKQELEKLRRKYLSACNVNDGKDRSDDDRFENLGYYYWDTIKNSSRDFDMEEASDETKHDIYENNKKILELPSSVPSSLQKELYEPMDIDDDSLPKRMEQLPQQNSESNYGSFYQGFYSPNK